MSENSSAELGQSLDTSLEKKENSIQEIWKESHLDSSGNVVESENESEPSREEQKRTGNRPELQYSREQLNEIRHLPASQIKPECLDQFPIQARYSFVKGVWERNNEPPSMSSTSAINQSSNRDRWPRSVTPIDSHDSYNDNKMRRDSRMRKDQDPGIILSPQRRSFNSGCLLSGNNNSLLPFMGLIGGFRDAPTTRRFGSGRLSSGSGWGSDNNSTGGGGHNADTHTTTFVAPNLMPDYTQRGQNLSSSAGGGGGAGMNSSSNGGNSSSMPYERRYNNNRDDKRMNLRNSNDYKNRNNMDYRNDYRSNGGDYRCYNNMNGGDRRRNNSERNDYMDEPEWFSGGPTSQNDVIELRGFNDDEKESPDKLSNGGKNSEGGPNNGGGYMNRLGNRDQNQRVNRKSSSDESKDRPTVERQKEDSRSSPEENKENRLHVKFAAEPTIDDLLNNLDTLPNLFSNEGDTTEAFGGSTQGGGSRFSRWFRKESPTSGSSPSPNMFNADSMLNDVMNDDHRGPNQFTPISPVFNGPGSGAPKMGGTTQKSNSSNNFLDLLKQDSSQHSSVPGARLGSTLFRSGSIRDLEGVGKLHSVEELEAKIRHHNPHHPNSGNPLYNKEEDMANFKKLLANSFDMKLDTPLSPQPHHSSPSSQPSAGSSSQSISNVSPPTSSSVTNSSSGENQQLLSGCVNTKMMNKLIQQAQLQQSLTLARGGGASNHSMPSGGGQSMPSGGQSMPSGGGQPGLGWNNLSHPNNGNSNNSNPNPNMTDLIQKMIKVQQMHEYQRRMSQLGGTGYIPPQQHGTSPLPQELQQHLLTNPQFDARTLIRPNASSGAPLSPNAPQGGGGGIGPQLPPPQLPPSSVASPASLGATDASFLTSMAALSQQQTQQLAQQTAQAQHLAAAAATNQQQQFMLHSQNATTPNSVFQQRAISPNQLVHQSLLQNALKKKLEEESLRKRHEMSQRTISPNLMANGPGGGGLSAHELRNSASSPVIPPFTPTSVLRKMTAAPGTAPLESHDSSKAQEMLLNHSQAGGHQMNAWQQRAALAAVAQHQQQSLSNKNLPSLMNFNQQQPPPAPNPRSKFTMSSKMNNKPNNLQFAQSVVEQMSAISSDPQHVQNNLFTSNHSQSNPQILSSANDQLEKWFSAARARPGGLPNIQQVPPTQNLLSVEELERLQQPVTSTVHN